MRLLNCELENRVAELSKNCVHGWSRTTNICGREIRADHPFENMVGSSPAFMELASRIQLVAGTSATVLICGETGTGKELVSARDPQPEWKARPSAGQGELLGDGAGTGGYDVNCSGTFAGAFYRRNGAARRAL